MKLGPSYGSGEAIASVAKQLGQLLRCHTLVWHNQLPSWGEPVQAAQPAPKRCIRWGQGVSHGDAGHRHRSWPGVVDEVRSGERRYEPVEWQ
jgi:GH35 family endo-1,4-beta-xylanase